jgi:hypothetical protein
VENGHWTLDHFTEAVNWGANVIRLPIHPVAWRERGAETYLGFLDQAAEWAHELGIYLILDWHSIGNLKDELFQHEMYVTDMDETREFWATVAERYQDEPAYFLYELFNEPTLGGQGQYGTCSWEEWKAINEELIEVIRAPHPKAVVAVAGFNWAYDLTPVGDQPIDAEGVAYISHPYPQKREAPWEEKWQEDWGFVSDNYPVVLTEIGFALPEEEGVHIPVEGDESYGYALNEFAAQRGISWLVWCFDPDWSPYMFTDWNYTPTRQGAFYKKVLSGN